MICKMPIPRIPWARCSAVDTVHIDVLDFKWIDWGLHRSLVACMVSAPWVSANSVGSFSRVSYLVGLLHTKPLGTQWSNIASVVRSGILYTRAL